LIAREEGILPGGGVADLRTITVLETAHLPGEEQLGVAPVKRALEEPLRQIAINAGFEDSVVLQHVIEGLGSFGFNAEIGTFEDFMTAGIVDPTKVSRLALQTAASVAGLLIAAEAMIAEKPGKKTPRHAQCRPMICINVLIFLRGPQGCAEIQPWRSLGSGYLSIDQTRHV
jgi:chaperonin GroEL